MFTFESKHLCKENVQHGLQIVFTANLVPGKLSTGALPFITECPWSLHLSKYLVD
jgi:hypothetical protein